MEEEEESCELQENGEERVVISFAEEEVARQELERELQLKQQQEFKTEQLVDLVQERSAIYDSKHKEHGNKPYIESLWQEIAQIMDSSVLECRTKWSSVRNSYARHLREKRHLKRKKKPWYLFEKVDFLREHITRQGQLMPSQPLNQVDERPSEFIEIQEASPYIRSKPSYRPRYRLAGPLQSSPAQSSPPQLATHNYSRSFESPASPDVSFFQSLFPEMQKLSAKRKRQFKELFITSLYRLLDEEEEERGIATSAFSSYGEGVSTFSQQ